jgi:ABC-2 type transport system ATP-binding protein
MSDPMIEIDGVAKRFGARTVLDGLSFTVGRGEIVGLLGPNGSGKTTTIRLITGVMEADGGSIRVDGLDPKAGGDAVRARSGILTESAGFYLHMTGLENLRLFADLYGVTERQRPQELLEEFGLGQGADRKVGTYSTGMKKRLGLAKALLHRPPILFLDEPTNGLDPEGIRMVLSYIVRLGARDGTTILICSHLLQQLETVCHRYLFLGNGRLIEAGTLPELEAKYGGEVVLRVETDLTPAGETFGGFAVRRRGEGLLEVTLPDRNAVPTLLRAILAEASVWGAQVTNRDLESIYFRIREVQTP